MEKPTPRVNSALREKYVGKTVRLVGKITSVIIKKDMYGFVITEQWRSFLEIPQY